MEKFAAFCAPKFFYSLTFLTYLLFCVDGIVTSYSHSSVKKDGKHLTNSSVNLDGAYSSNSLAYHHNKFGKVKIRPTNEISIEPKEDKKSAAEESMKKVPVINLNEIVLKIMEENVGTNEEEKQLDKCRRVSAAIAWSIFWELELLKMENASFDALGEENEPKKFKQLEENIGKLYSGTQTAKEFESCRNYLKEILQNLKNEKNDFGQFKNIQNIADLGELDDIKKGNWEKTKIDKFMENFLAKNKFELELAKEFSILNEILGKNFATKQDEKNIHLIVSNELVKIISVMHQLVEELNVSKIGKIVTDNLAVKAKKLNDEWIKVEKSDNLKSLHEKVGNMIQNISSIASSSWYRWDYDAKLLQMKYWINLLRWNVLPKESEIDMHRNKVQQFVVKLALLRRFLRNEFLQKNEAKIKRDEQNKEYNVKQNELLKDKLKQKIKWIMRRKQRLEDEMPDVEKKNFNSKLTEIFEKIDKELKKYSPTSRRDNDHAFFEGLLKQSLRQYYYGKEDEQTLKIRVKTVQGSLLSHALLALGNEYEYDYLQHFYAPRRLIFKKWIDVKMDENNIGKAQPIKGLDQKFSVAKADEIFFDMPAKGWTPRNFSFSGMRYCASYIYEFIFHLNGDKQEKCPAMENWPKPYRDIDHILTTHEEANSFKMVSLFSKKYASYRRDKFNQHKREDNNECAISELEIQILMIKGKKWREMEQQQKEKNEMEGLIGNSLGESSDKMLPPAIVVYDTGRFSDFRHQQYKMKGNKFYCPFDFTEPLNIQEHLVKEQENDKAILYSALLKVNVCNVDGVRRAFVNNLFLLDAKMEYVVHQFGGANLYEENDGGHHLFKYEFGENKGKMDKNKSCVTLHNGLGIYYD